MNLFFILCMETFVVNHNTLTKKSQLFSWDRYPYEFTSHTSQHLSHLKGGYPPVLGRTLVVNHADTFTKNHNFFLKIDTLMKLFIMHFNTSHFEDDKRNFFIC